MTTETATVSPDMPLKQVARLLIERGISGLPVVENGEVVGVISEADILAKERAELPRPAGALAWILDRPDADGERRLAARTAGEAMTAPAITIPGFYPVATAAKLMLEHGIKRLPVVDGSRLAGIVTRTDLVRAFARSDDEVLSEVREQVELQQALCGDQGAVAVTVAGGDTHLAGEVRYRHEADILPRMVATVPGVVTLTSELTWREENV